MSLVRDTGRHLLGRHLFGRRVRRRRSGSRHPGRHRSRPAVVLRSVALAAVVFVVAAFTGAQLAGAEPAGSPEVPPCPTGDGWHATGAARDHSGEPVAGPASPTFALSLIYSGSGALAVSVLGLVIVGRRRRHW